MQKKNPHQLWLFLWSSSYFHILEEFLFWYHTTGTFFPAPKFVFLLFPSWFLIEKKMIYFTSLILASLKISFATTFRGICKLDYICMVRRSPFFIAVMFINNFFKPKAQVFLPIKPQSCLKTVTCPSLLWPDHTTTLLDLYSSSVRSSIGIQVNILHHLNSRR